MSEDGTLLSCGLNDTGQLGTNLEQDAEESWEDVFCRVTVLPEHEKVVQVALGNTHTLVLTEAGRVYSWGGVKNDNTAETSQNFGPYHVPFDVNDRPTFVDCGWDFCLVLTASGSVWSWGSDDYSALGRPGTGNKNCPGRLDIPEEIVSIAAGSAHVLALSKSGEVYGWGWNAEHNQLGLPGRSVPSPLKLDFLSGIGVTQVAGGVSYSYALTKNGVLYGFGKTSRGELGQISDTLLAPGVPVPLPKKVISVATGYSHSIAVLDDGSLWTWGESRYDPEGQKDWSEAPVEVTLPGLRRRDEGNSEAEDQQKRETTEHKHEGETSERMEHKYEGEGQRKSEITEHKHKREGQQKSEITEGEPRHEGEGKPEGEDIQKGKKEEEEDITVVSIMCSLDNSLVELSNGKIFVWGFNNSSEFGLGHRQTVYKPVEIQKTKFWVPPEIMAKRQWWFMKLLFLGRLDKGASVYRLPEEVLFNFADVLKYLQ
jgi:alpha-tubulin suppressor-like RCC1 family protein